MCAATQDMIAIAQPLSGHALEQFIVKGDLSVLGSEDKAKHYLWVCERAGLDAATKPLEYIKLNGKEVLYCKKEGTDQLRKIHRVAVQITQRERIDDVYVVTARATTPDGRTDESQGAVTIGNLKGDNLCNAIMKAETKAKRRVTLSICGLSMLDESELETIPTDRFASLKPEDRLSAPVAQLADKRASAAKPVQAAKATVPKWTSDQPIPEVVLKSIQALHVLRNAPMASLVEDDLDAVIEHGKIAYGKWSQMPGVNPKLLALLQEVIVCAQVLVDAKRGLVPPTDDGPPLDDDAYGNEDGEVRS